MCPHRLCQKHWTQEVNVWLARPSAIQRSQGRCSGAKARLISQPERHG